MEPTGRAIRSDLLRGSHGLRVWHRRPQIWLAWALVLGVIVALIAFSDSSSGPVRTQDRGDVVRATVLPSWDGGQHVPVRWRNPSTGHLRDIVVPEEIATVRHVGPVDLRVVPGHEDEGRPVGSRAPAHVVTDSRILIDGSADRTSWIFVLPVLLGMFIALGAWSWSRRRRVRQGTEALVAASGPVATWIAVPRRGVVLPRRWTVALFDVGAGPGARSVRRFRVSPGAGPPGPRQVEVHGDGDRWRHSILVEPGTGQQWLPLGRPLRQHVEQPETKDTELDRWWPTGVLLVAVGLVMVIAGAVRHHDLVGALNTRSEPVTVTLQQPVPAQGGSVSVTYRIDGRSYPAKVRLGGPQRTEAQVVLRRDPVQPLVLWQDGTASAPVTGSNTGADLLQTAGWLAAIAGSFLLRRPRTPGESGRPAWATSWAAAPAGPTLAPGWGAMPGPPSNAVGGPQYPPWAWPPPPPPWSPGTSTAPYPPTAWGNAQPASPHSPSGWVPPPTFPAAPPARPQPWGSPSSLPGPLPPPPAGAPAASAIPGGRLVEAGVDAEDVASGDGPAHPSGTRLPGTLSFPDHRARPDANEAEDPEAR